MKNNDKLDFFEKPENIKKLWIMLCVVCALLVVSDFFTRRELHFGFDGFFGFYALLGFVSCAALIVFSKLVGLVLKVKEDYYDN